jgi:hypothetical protein
MVRVSSGLIWMNMEERQQPRHVPQGTSAPPFPDRKEASVERRHSEKLPAGWPSNPLDASLSHCSFLRIAHDPSQAWMTEDDRYSPLLQWQSPEPDSHVQPTQPANLLS